MDKVSSLFRPYQIGTRVQGAIATLTREGAVLGQALTGIVGIQQVLTRLSVLNLVRAEQHIEIVTRHAQLLAYLSDGEAGDGVEHMVGIVGTGFQSGDLLVTALEGGLHDLKRTSQDDFIAFVGACHHVASLLSDGRKDLAGDPLPKLLGLRLSTFKDGVIKTVLIDKGGLLYSSQVVDDGVL